MRGTSAGARSAVSDSTVHNSWCVWVERKSEGEGLDVGRATGCSGGLEVGTSRTVNARTYRLVHVSTCISVHNTYRHECRVWREGEGGGESVLWNIFFAFVSWAFPRAPPTRVRERSQRVTAGCFVLCAFGRECAHFPVLDRTAAKNVIFTA